MLKVHHNVSILTAYCAFIFYLSHQSTLPVSMMFAHQDKLIHGLAYAVMGILAWRAFYLLNKPMSLTLILSILFCSFYGVTDEYHQSFIAGREADIWDWLADTTGAAIAVFSIARFGGRK